MPYLWRCILHCALIIQSRPADIALIPRLIGVACADVLAGRKTVGTIKGTVVYAGHKPSRSFLRRYTGYVEQFGDALLLQPSATARTDQQTMLEISIDSERLPAWAPYPNNPLQPRMRR